MIRNTAAVKARADGPQTERRASSGRFAFDNDSAAVHRTQPKPLNDPVLFGREPVFYPLFCRIAASARAVAYLY